MTGQNEPNNPRLGPLNLSMFGKYSLEVVDWGLPWVCAQSSTLLKLLVSSDNTVYPAKS